MSAGYNGLESGHTALISLTLLIISLLSDTGISFSIIFAGLFGSIYSIYLFNKYPSKIFVGDVGTLSFGAVIATACVMSNLAIYGVICIIPAFYELYATLKYKIKGIKVYTCTWTTTISVSTISPRVARKSLITSLCIPSR